MEIDLEDVMDMLEEAAEEAENRDVIFQIRNAEQLLQYYIEDEDV